MSMVKRRNRGLNHIKRTLGIADLSQQHRLNQRVEQLLFNDKKHMDSISDLTFYTHMNNKKIEALINSTRIYYSSIKMVQDHLYTVNEDIHYRRILDNYKTAWLSDTLIRGVLNNQIQTA